MSPSCFDRPIIILSAPRSGSTLLFEVLSHSQSLWTIGGESHQIIEKHRQLNITHKKFASNALDESDWDENIEKALLTDFQSNLIDSQNRPYQNDIGKVRFLEKTPKNSLRVPFLNKLFPDAYFVYLVRDPKANISSIMQAWQSQRFRTYPNLPGWGGDWSLLLPPNWQSLRGKALAEVAAFQWLQANQAIIESLSQLPQSRWQIINYDELITHPAQTVAQIAHHCEFAFDAELQTLCLGKLPYSRYTVSTPQPNKWLMNYHKIQPLWPRLQSTLAQINLLLQRGGQPQLTKRWPDEMAPSQNEASSQVNAEPTPEFQAITRNAPCPCGSNKRFKLCHGQLK